VFDVCRSRTDFHYLLPPRLSATESFRLWSSSTPLFTRPYCATFRLFSHQPCAERPAQTVTHGFVLADDPEQFSSCRLPRGISAIFYRRTRWTPLTNRTGRVWWAERASTDSRISGRECLRHKKICCSCYGHQSVFHVRVVVVVMVVVVVTCCVGRTTP